MAFCSQCGEAVRDDAAFCTACGKPVGEPTEPTSTASEPAPSEPAASEPAAPPPSEPPASPPPPVAPESPASGGGSGINTRALLIGGIAAVSVVAIAVAGWFISQQADGDDASDTPAAASSTVDTDPATTTTSVSTTTSTTITTTTLPPTTTTTLSADLIAGLESTGVFVAPGSTADQASLEQSVANALNHGWALSVVAVPAEPDEGASASAGAIATELSLGTVVVVFPDGLGWASQETQFYDGEFERAWGLIPARSTEAQAVDAFVRAVLGGPDSVGVMDPGSAYWLLLQADGLPTEFTYGDPDDVPLIGDWDCDGIETPGVYRPSTTDILLRNSTSAGAAEISTFFDVDPDQETVEPISGDFDGDGCSTIAFRFSSDSWVTVFNTPQSVIATGEETVPPDAGYPFGEPGDIAFAGDFDGDGIDTISLFRPSTGTFFLKNTNTEGPADIEFGFGAAGDIPIAGDWTDQDGIDSVAVYRPSTGTFFFRYSNSAGPADETLEFGVTNALPVAGAIGLDRSG